VPGFLVAFLPPVLSAGTRLFPLDFRKVPGPLELGLTMGSLEMASLEGSSDLLDLAWRRRLEVFGMVRLKSEASLELSLLSWVECCRFLLSPTAGPTAVDWALLFHAAGLTVVDWALGRDLTQALRRGGVVNKCKSGSWGIGGEVLKR
jgi:hypothetical protein